MEGRPQESPAPEPAFAGVLETVLYYSQGEREEVHVFYGELLGLREVAGWPYSSAYRIGQAVLLLFCRELLAERDGPIAAHGTVGPGHACLLAEPGGYEACRRHLDDGGVEVTHEQEWSQGRRSFYFEDPAGNLIEIAEADIWPREAISK